MKLGIEVATIHCRDDLHSCVPAWRSQDSPKNFFDMLVYVKLNSKGDRKGLVWNSWFVRVEAGKADIFLA